MPKNYNGFDESQFLKPFDDTYDNITKRIRLETINWQQLEKQWMEDLIAGFKSERDQWPTNADLARFASAWLKLKTKPARLAAAAYLHISYDLPRVIAKNWPGQAGIFKNLEEQHMDALFHQLDSIFPDAFADICRKRNIFGWSALFLKITPADLLKAGAIWTLLLRGRAWGHARTIAQSGYPNGYIESRMLEAMTSAVEDYYWYLPWTVTRLSPPNSAFLRASSLASILIGLNLTDILLLAILFCNLFGLLVVIASRLYIRKRRQEIEVDTLGWIVSMYVHQSVQDPEGFDIWRRQMVEKARARR